MLENIDTDSFGIYIGFCFFLETEYLKSTRKSLLVSGRFPMRIFLGEILLKIMPLECNRSMSFSYKGLLRGRW